MKPVLRTIILILAIAAAAGFVAGVAEVRAQSFWSQGFLRNAALVLIDTVEAALLRAGALTAAVLVLTAIAGRIPVLRAQAIPAALGILAFLLRALPAGYEQNRIFYRESWRAREAVLGLSIPRAFLEGHVWLGNVAIVGKALLVGGAVAVSAWLVIIALRKTPLPGLCRRIALPAGIAAALFVLLLHAGTAVLFARAPGGPNVILISLDTLRADYLGCYGETRDTSPAIDRFARSSVLFENAYSQAPNTLLSHGSLLTSRYPSVNMASAEGKKVPKWRIFAAEIFREAGYRTLGIVDSHFLTKTYGLEQGYDRYVRRGDGAKRIVAKAKSWLDRYAGKPFFLFVHIYDIHSPYARTAPYKKRFVEKPYDGPVSSNSMELVKYQRQVRRGENPDLAIDEAATEYLRALYAGGIRETDDAIAPFLRYLEESPLGENTIVVLTSDHGEEFLEHGSVLHAELYRTVTHVPLIIRLPGGERGGERVARAVGLVDVLPTLLAVTGVETPGKVSGQSLSGLMRGDGAGNFRRFSFSEINDSLGTVATLNDRFHLVGKVAEGRWELFEYRNDRLEQEDLFAHYPETTDSLTRLISLWRREIEADIAAEAGRRTESVELDEATVRELKAFGYLD